MLDAMKGILGFGGSRKEVEELSKAEDLARLQYVKAELQRRFIEGHDTSKGERVMGGAPPAPKPSPYWAEPEREAKEAAPAVSQLITLERRLLVLEAERKKQEHLNRSLVAKLADVTAALDATQAMLASFAEALKEARSDGAQLGKERQRLVSMVKARGKGDV